MEPQLDYGALAVALLAKLNEQQNSRAKAVSSTPTAVYGHGPGGVFNTPGARANIWSAMLLPFMGMVNRIPVRTSNETNPLWFIMTGVTASSGSNPVGVCDDPKTAGLMKLCAQTSYFGRLSMQSPVIDIDRIGKVINRGEQLDYTLTNSPESWGNNPLVPTMPGGATAAQALRNEVSKIFFEMGIAFMRDFAKLVYNGNPANNTTGGGYKEWRGLDMEINTNHKDVITDIACPAADSIIKDFGSLNISGQANAANAAALFALMRNVYRALRWLSIATGLAPVKWVIAMNQSLFWDVSEIWACNYAATACNTFLNAASIAYNPNDAVALRDAMRGDMAQATGQYLLFDGEKVEVVLDQGISYTTSNGGADYLSDIYFIPETVLGRIPVLYWEFVNYDMPNGALDAARLLAPDGSYMTSDGGRFLWHKKPPTNFCVQVVTKTEPRLILETPQISARILNVKWTPSFVEISPFPGDPTYRDGGSTMELSNWHNYGTNT